MLIIGYGNPDRQDDGIAWHILKRCAERLGLEAPPSYEEGFPGYDGPVQFIFSLQLMPEMAEDVAKHDKVVFVDAHTGAIPDDLHIEEVSAAFQSSPLTHHFTPQSCLSLAASLYGAAPQALLISARGYYFQFTHELSPATEALIEPAVEKILAFCQ